MLLLQQHILLSFTSIIRVGQALWKSEGCPHCHPRGGRCPSRDPCGLPTLSITPSTVACASAHVCLKELYAIHTISKYIWLPWPTCRNRTRWHGRRTLQQGGQDLSRSVDEHRFLPCVQSHTSSAVQPPFSSGSILSSTFLGY